MARRRPATVPSPARTPEPGPAPSRAGQGTDRRQVRLVALVLAATMALWMFASWAGGFYGWQPRFAFLFDFMALAAFAWALIVSWRLWRARHARNDN